ncbi:hypothetical protein BDA96_08G105800 [Sorghum bicolor]|uniref:Uncharacterized protein n=1 Tax=Sorghum bicolor TaxID=4558 RepID=A0A921QHV9_SORBI|nr:hypothetical protein BDA96_08G105800 [Sorghum bicolor]
MVAWCVRAGLASLLGRVGVQSSTGQWGHCTCRVGFRAQRMAVKRHGGASRRPLAWRGRATGRPRTRTGSGLISLVPVKNICADLVLTARGESNHMLHGTGRRAGPTTAAAVPCAGSRQAGSGRMDAIMPRGRGRGRGFVPPARSFAGRIAQCPTQARTCSKRKKKTQARTHARTPPAELRLRGRLVHELQLPVALRARPECGWCMLMGYRRRPKFAGFGWRVVEQFHPFRRFCVSIRVFFFFCPRHVRALTMHSV